MLPPGGSTLLTHMYLMVDFFFILSGFIMCHVYGNRFLKDVQITEFKKFTIARFQGYTRFTSLRWSPPLSCFMYSRKWEYQKMTYLQADNNSYSVFTNLFLVQAMNFNKWFTWVSCIMVDQYGMVGLYDFPFPGGYHFSN